MVKCEQQSAVSLTLYNAHAYVMSKRAAPTPVETRLDSPEEATSLGLRHGPPFEKCEASRVIFRRLMISLTAQE